MSKWEEELRKLSEYMNIYIQLLPHFIVYKYDKYRLPKFQYFKNTYDSEEYSLIKPHFKEAKDVYDDVVVSTHLGGLGATNGIGFRYYNIWLTRKYYLSDWIVNIPKVKEILRNNE